MALIAVVVLAVRGLTGGGETEATPTATATTVSSPAPIERDMSGWDATRIIDDDVFYDSTSMTRAEISAFITKANKGCTTGKDGTVCLAAARFNTTTQAATTACPGGYAGAKNESAATIISKVSASCGINPEVLLVLIQKEQGLLTASGSTLNASRYRAATGYDCPDHSTCDAAFRGFFLQVYGAASQFQKYRLNPSKFQVVAGVSARVSYSPDAACGSKAITVKNQATAGLYDYTPYQPNKAASSGGDSCTSWGNWNFYGYFKTLFGDPTP